ncbi:MAG TPA: hypothetical protein VHF67_01330 [Gaiellaceae bacterium]|jgi:hypothetical protein|nr:hypothetical protein [Gaiellaceae bacterium]
MRKLFPLAAALVAAVLIQASPAFGHPPVECTGEMTGTIEADLVVPSGATCVLTDAHVTGDVVVESSARLDALNTRIEGDIDCSGGPSAEERWCDLLPGTVVEGRGIARAGGELHLHGGQILGNVRAEPDSVFLSSPVENLFPEASGFVGGNVRCDRCIFVDLVRTTVEGNVRIRGEADGSFIAEGSEIFGSLEIARSAAGSFSFSVVGTTIHGNFRFERNTGPTEIRDNVIDGNLLIIRNDVAGAFCPPDAPAEECPIFENGHVTGNQVGGSLRLIANEGPLELRDNRIEGDLRCARNDPPPAGGGNVASRKTGQCSAL